MLALDEILKLLNDKARKLPPEVSLWQRIYYGMSLHIDGVVPQYQYLRDVSLGWVAGNFIQITPARYAGAEYQSIFDSQLLNRHPREPEMIRQYRLSQYKPWTKAPFIQVIQVITGAIFQDSAYSISIAEKADDDYIWGNNFNGTNLVGRISKDFQDIVGDANGFFVVIPDKSRREYSQTSEKVEPQIRFVHTKHLLYISKDEIVWKDKDYVWVINAVGYFRFFEIKGKWVNADGDGDGYYAHNLGVMPIVVAGGQWNSQGYYDSWLDPAKAVADEFVSAKSAEQLVNKEASHPWIVAMSTDCPECDNGKIQYCKSCSCDTSSCECGDATNYSLINCDKCGGTGNISRNPGEWLIVPYEEMDREPIRLINPDVAINKFHAENNEAIYQAILSALHLHYIDSAQSGTAKDKDMETRYQFIMRISNDIYDRLIPSLIKFICGIRNVSVVDGVVRPAEVAFTIVKPTQFQIKTAQDLLNEYDIGTKSGLPDFMRARQLIDYTDKQYGGDDVLIKKTGIILQLDPIAVTSKADVQVMLLGGAITQRDVQFNAQLPRIIDQIIRDRSEEWFRAASYDHINVEVQRIFTAINPPPLPLNSDDDPAAE